MDDGSRSGDNSPVNDPSRMHHTAGEDAGSPVELPELTLSLRRFGSSRRPLGSPPRTTPHDIAAIDPLDAAQEQFFAPLLTARRTAANAASAGDRERIVAAFDGRRLTAIIDATLRAFATERLATDPPARRAFEAELGEIVEPLRVALARLRDVSRELADARDDTDEVDDRWRGWLEQLGATFRIADAVWSPLCDALHHAPTARPRVRRWLRIPFLGGRR